MNKGLLIGLVVLVIIVLGAGLYFVTSGKSVDCEKATSPYKSVSQDIAILQCYTKLAEDKNDGSACDAAKNELTRQACYITVGQKLGDISVCPKITEEKSVQTCYMGVAATNKDYAICDTYVTEGPSRDACRAGVKYRIDSGQ